jgi:hypothetical protein
VDCVKAFDWICPAVNTTEKAVGDDGWMVGGWWKYVDIKCHDPKMIQNANCVRKDLLISINGNLS